MADFHTYDLGPVFRMTVPDQFSDPYRIEINWCLTESDASCWRRPIAIVMTSMLTDNDDELVLHLSREDARVLRDCLGLMLRSPDLRQDGNEVWSHLHVPTTLASSSAADVSDETAPAS